MIIEVSVANERHMLTTPNFNESDYWLVRINGRAVGFLMFFKAKTEKYDKILFEIRDEVDYNVYHRHQVGNKTAVCLGLDMDSDRIIFIDLFADYEFVPCTLEDIKFFVDPLSTSVENMLMNRYDLNVLTDYLVNGVSIADKLLKEFSVDAFQLFLHRRGKAAYFKDETITAGNAIKSLKEDGDIKGFILRIPILPTNAGDTTFIILMKKGATFKRDEENIVFKKTEGGKRVMFDGVSFNRVFESTKDEISKELGLNSEKEVYVFIDEIMKNHIKGKHVGRLSYDMYKKSVA